MLKRIMLLLTTFTVLFAFVTYQPKKVDANGVTQVVSFAAKQALRAATKSAVNDTVGSLALKTATKEVADQYVKKEGLNLVVLEGGKKVLAKTTMNQTEKVLLKKEIDNVIDIKIYGNSPKWVKFIDWFIGVGTVILIGEILTAAITGDFNDFISEIFNEAMTNLGWLVTPQKLTDPSPDNPVNYPETTPEYDYTTTAPSYNNINISQTYTYNVNIDKREFFYFPVKLPQPQYFDGSIFYTEIQPTSSNGLIMNDLRLNEVMHSGSTFNSLSLTVDEANPRSIKMNNARSLKIFKAGKLIFSESYSTATTKTMDLTAILGSSYWGRYYNRVIRQNRAYLPEANQTVSRLILQDTYLRQNPDIYMQITHNNGFDSTRIFDNYSFSYYSWLTPKAFPFQAKVGYFRDINLALTTDMLPLPKLNPTDVRIPIVSHGKVYLPTPSMFPDGYVYNPNTQTITDPAGNPVTDPSTIPEKNPDPSLETSPDGELIVDGVPIGQPAPAPIPSPGTTTPDGGGGSITTGDPKEINWAKLKAIPGIFTKKFPFSLPWDAKRFVDSVLGSIPQAKDISVKLDEIGGMHIGMDITLPDFFDPFFDFSRIITLIIFDIGLIYGLYRLLGGAS